MESSTIHDQRPSATARATVLVEHLDGHGEAVAQIESWLSQPTAEEWAAIHGSRAASIPLPDRCTFTGGLPGERLDVELSWTLPRPGRKHARRVPAPRIAIRAVLVSSPQRVAPLCPVFGTCGGCQLQHMAYLHQLAWKTARVRDALHAAGLDDAAVEPAIACVEPWRYRNHMRFSVDRSGRLGLTARHSHRVLPLRACPIAHPLINRALELLADSPQRRPQALVRCGAATGQMLIQPEPDAATRALLEASGLDVRTDTLEERLRVPDTDNTVAFRIRPSSFFQTNTEQANIMAQAVVTSLPTGAHITLVDAYCGVGTFAALLAPHAGRVLAIEESASAVRDARWNLRDAANVEVIQAKTEAILPTLVEPIDGLVIDPPRAGCQPAVLEALCARRVPRVVYVSCEPNTLARDLAYLCQKRAVYRIARVLPLDMFPQTAHIETIVSLEVA